MKLPRPDCDALGIDLDRALVDETRFLVDGRFLSALHREMAERLGAEDARAALLQLGFLHGMRDGARAMRSGGLLGASATPATPARLGMRFARRAARAGATSLELRGTWPERCESRAVTAALGERSGPSCFASVGYTSGWLSALFEVDILAVEHECSAAGAPTCGFVAREARAWEECGDPRARGLLAQLPFPDLRLALAGEASESGECPDPCAFDPDSPAVHVWGPVMVVPFSGEEETLRAIELIGQDPGARCVSVVVVDLAGTLVDEGFGALALERVLVAAQSWGAETILTGVSPLSEPVVAELVQPHVLIRKDLPEAIAAAFQIADAARHAV